MPSESPQPQGGEGDELLQKLLAHSAVIGIIGMGYVGLPLMLRFTEVGFRVLGLDIDEKKNSQLNAGKSYIAHIPSEQIAAAVKKGFEATGDFARSTEADALIICVPTPLDKYREPDLSYVTNTLDSLVPYLRRGQIVSLESTTYPGTTEEEIKPRVESTGLKVGENIFLVYSPEREDPANLDHTTQTIPKLCGGMTGKCLEMGVALYGEVVKQVVPTSSPKVAEMTKLLENIHRAVNIGLVNEMKILADRMGIDIHEVVRCAATKPFGFTPYYPGPGLGGHCIPIDPFYLTWKAREFGLHTRFIELAGEINNGMPSWVVTKISEALNSRGLPVKGCRILVLGISYKKNVDDMRESPAVTIMELLRDMGALLDYSDPFIPKFPPMREHHFDLSSVPITAENLESYQCVVLATDHSDFDYLLIGERSPLLVDTRGVFTDPRPNIVKA